MAGAIGQRQVKPEDECGDGCEDLLNGMHAAKRESDSVCSTASERCRSLLRGLRGWCRKTMSDVVAAARLSVYDGRISYCRKAHGGTSLPWSSIA
jgi:hypothetical protein